MFLQLTFSMQYSLCFAAVYRLPKLPISFSLSIASVINLHYIACYWYSLQNSFYADSLKLSGVRDILDVETKYEYVAV